MIRALDGLDPACRKAESAFLAAAEAQPLPGAGLASAWYAFGKQQARGTGGWHFFTAGPGEAAFALALRGGIGWACGRHDAGELGDFLRYTHTARLTLRAGDDLPEGFAPAERLRGFCLPVRPDTPAPPPLPDGWRLARLKDAGPLAGFLLREGAFEEDGPACRDAAAGQDAPKGQPVPAGPIVPAGEEGRPRPADPPVPAAPAAQNTPAGSNCPEAGRQAAALFARELNARAAVGLGYAALLTGPDGWPAAGLAALTGVHSHAVCLEAVQVRADLRGRGLGGWLVQTAAAIAHHGGSALWLLCIPQRARFYARLGFEEQGGWLCLAPAPQGGRKPALSAKKGEERETLSARPCPEEK